MITIDDYNIFPIKEHTLLYNNLSNKDIYIEDTCEIFSKKILKLISDFLHFQITYGNNKSLFKSFINNDGSINYKSYIKRLLTKRPVSFYGYGDAYLLRPEHNSLRGHGLFTDIGTSQEKDPITINNYISYDEIEISSFISASIRTPFLNNGHRKNNGKLTNDHVKEGFYIGQCGPRFEENNKMEYKYIIIDPRQNTFENGYGSNNNSINGLYLKIWSSFYETDLKTYDEVLNDTSGRYIKIPDYIGIFFDTLIYKKRLKINAEVFFDEAIKKSIQFNKKVFCHIVGLGLGAWSIFSGQDLLFLEAYFELLTEKYNIYKNISEIYFAWLNITPNEIQNIKNFNNIQQYNIKFGYRNPADPLPNDQLLIANWAWDPNSYIGNEYYVNLLGTSGDPAAASSSFIAYY